MIELQLKKPTPMDKNGEIYVTHLTIREPLGGDILRARAAIANDVRLGTKLINDQMTLMSTMLKTTVVQMTPPVPRQLLQPHWIELLAIDDLSRAVDAQNALSGGYDSLEAYETQVKQRVAYAKELMADGEKEEEAARKAEAAFPDPVRSESSAAAD